MIPTNDAAPDGYPYAPGLREVTFYVDGEAILMWRGAGWRIGDRTALPMLRRVIRYLGWRATLTIAARLVRIRAVALYYRQAERLRRRER